MALTVPTLFVCFLLILVQVQGSVRLSSSLHERNEADGNRKKFIIDLKGDEDNNFGNSVMDGIGKRFRRYLKNSKIKSHSVSIFIACLMNRLLIFKITIAF